MNDNDRRWSRPLLWILGLALLAWAVVLAAGLAIAGAVS